MLLTGKGAGWGLYLFLFFSYYKAFKIDFDRLDEIFLHALAHAHVHSQSNPHYPC